MSYYFHAVPGRLRVRTPIIKRRNNIEEIKELLESMDGINSFDINTITGSILINYDSQVITEKKIVRMLKQTDYFDPSKAITNDLYIHTAVSKIGHTAVSFLTMLI